MAGNGGVSSSTGVGASIRAAATAVGSVEPRFAPQERRSRWKGCFGGFSCFGSQKGGGKRIVPASRMPDGNALNHGNGLQPISLSNQNTTLNLSLLAPPSSPASFTNSALPSTAQSPSCYLSLSNNSPDRPSSNMYTTGPYAHETQLVSPPAFSTYTTEPSTAPLTPPPELSHHTTPSSPDVPYARFLSSSMDLKGGGGKGNSMQWGDFQANYPLYPWSCPSSNLISPASGTPRTGLSSLFPERETNIQWGAPIPSRDHPYSRNGSSKLFGLDSATSKNFTLSPNPSFLYPATSAQFYLDQAQQSHIHCADSLSTGGGRLSKACKQDVEEIEAYRASFGFSADEIITTQNYVEIADDSFTMSPFVNNNDKAFIVGCPEINLTGGCQKLKATEPNMLDTLRRKTSSSDQAAGDGVILDPSKALAGPEPDGLYVGTCHSDRGSSFMNGASSCSFLNKTPEPQFNKRILTSGQSCSDAEIDYRRARSLRDARGILAWHSSLP